MLLKITEACSMGCTHCMNDAKPDGAHMTYETFQAVIDFIIKHRAYQHIIISGGEPTEHPAFPMFMGYAIAALNEIKEPKAITITTNGFWILNNISCAKEIVAAANEHTLIQFQVSTDTRYYPNMKFCTPAIRIDGSISLGESDLCPKVASIYDKEEDIIQKIKDFKCNGCYPLNENLPFMYKQFVS